ncbi:hypothetical protein [Candidatus Nitrotoga arctica]|uniref:Uncharacterized protein n=1 Tax=Candidatus Nitrotoga arctica TaxID=453162 RepID=A0ABN8AN44_9PROT|nr:hypothetical protein [Candidatus Nitrotoga arctica]CAG9932088.1 protein of unknown function [Candidatus Nitrotoga arctica]
MAKLAEKHTSILAFIEEYILNPIHTSAVEKRETDDAVIAHHNSLDKGY